MHKRDLSKIFRDRGEANILSVLRRYHEIQKTARDGPYDPIRDLIKLLNRDLRAEDSAIRRAAQTAASSIDNANRIQVDRQIEHAIGEPLSHMELPGLDDNVARAVKRYLRDNIKYAKKARRRFLRELMNITLEHFLEGAEAGTLEQRLLERLDVSVSRARLIAADQTGKLFGALTEVRHREVGVREYIWQTSLDERVRAEHRAREGEIFSYVDPPYDGNPGYAILCRCTAGPVFRDL